MAPSYLVLLRAGFTWPAGHPAAGGLLPHHFTLTGAAGGVFSVALSFGSPRLGVTQRPALWSPDFPPRPRRSGAVTCPPRPKPDVTPTCPFPRRSHDWPARRHRGCARAARG